MQRGKGTSKTIQNVEDIGEVVAELTYTSVHNQHSHPNL
jgi:hypothetical protein